MDDSCGGALQRLSRDQAPEGRGYIGNAGNVANDRLAQTKARNWIFRLDVRLESWSVTDISGRSNQTSLND
jgi:hypothetical protein